MTGFSYNTRDEADTINFSKLYENELKKNKEETEPDLLKKMISQVP
jgi:hypothetical protein